MTKHKSISKVEVEINGRHFTLQFTREGLIIREKWARDQRVLSIARLVKMDVDAGDQRFADCSPAQRLHVAACDLATVAELLHIGNADQGAAQDAAKSNVRAVRILRELI